MIKIIYRYEDIYGYIIHCWRYLEKKTSMWENLSRTKYGMLKKVIVMIAHNSSKVVMKKIASRRRK